MSSKAQKNAGFLLPAEIDPQQAICVEFQIPDTPEYRAAVRGHVEQLGKHWVWEKSGLPGDNRAGDASRLFSHSIFHTFKFDDDCLKCETPFWYDADTVDDDECCEEDDEDCEESEDQNQWLEDAADWIITAFIATTLTPGAAIAYRTVIPRMRLFFRTGDLGAIANIFIDGILWGAVNTALSGAPELITTIIDLDEFRQIHDLAPDNIIRIVHDVPAAAAALPGGEFQAMSEPEYKLEVVRGDIRAPRLCDAFTEKPTYEELNDAYFECYGEDIPQMFDVRVQGCLLQKTTDGGLNWTTVQDLTECAPPPGAITFEQVDCTLTANNVVIFDASCATPETPPEDTPEETPGTPVNSHAAWCAGADYLTDYLFEAAWFVANNFDEFENDLQAATSGLLVALANMRIFPYVTLAVAALEWFYSNALIDFEGWLSNPNNQSEVKCVIYCAIKKNQGFNDAAWADIIAGLQNPNYAPFVTPSGSHFSFIVENIVRQPAASKAFYIGSLNEDNTCEAECTDCVTPSWTYGLNYFPIECRPSQYIDLIRGSWRNDYTEITTELVQNCESFAIAVIDLRDFNCAIERVQGGSPAYPIESGCTQPRLRWIKALNEATGQWYTVYEGTNALFGNAAWLLQPMSRVVEIGIQGHVGGGAEYFWFTLWGKGENPFAIECDNIQNPPEE